MADSKSDTPRTDHAEIYYREIIEDPDSPMYLVSSDFARQLEREVAAEKARAEGLEKALRFAAGMVSVHHPFHVQHPQVAYDYIINAARDDTARSAA